MSDQSFGKAAREYWDEIESAAAWRSQALFYRAHAMGVKLKTQCDKKPIPDRSHDWSAIDDATYDGPGCDIGWGATENDAIEDLLDKLDQRELPE